MNNVLAYTAGYIDGDGCFYIGRTTNKKTNKIKYQAVLVIASTNKEVLSFFAELYGGSLRLSDKREKHAGQKPQYQLCLRPKYAINLIKQILPFLIEKKQQAIYFCDFVAAESTDTKDFLMSKMIDEKHVLNMIYDDSKEWIFNFKKPTIPTITDYAYLAGFIDAECCLSINRYKNKERSKFYYKIELSCNNSKYPIFPWLINHFGGQLYFIGRKRKNSSHRNQLLWKLTSRSLAKILPLIKPHLRYKKEVCEKMIEFNDLTLKNGGDRQSASFKATNTSIAASKKEIIHQIHLLNLKGVN